MIHARFPFVILILALLAPPVWAEKLSLDSLSKYLNDMRTAKTEFTQVNADGTLATGTIYIKRPGRIRFEYNPPDKSLVLASNGQLAIFDPKGDGAESYPLNKTPLSLILDKNINLGRAKMVTGHNYDSQSKATVLTAQDPEHPEYGNIRLVFTGPTPQLRQWVITNENGTETTVILGDMENGLRLPNRLFEINLNQGAQNR